MTEGVPGPSAREVALARRVLIVIGALYLVLQLLLFSIHRYPGWDESVYFSQVTPGVRAMFFIPARARGVPVLVAPVTLLGGSTVAVRLYLVVASTIAVTAVFWAWLPLLGAAVPIASFLLCFSWLGLLNGSEALPNPWAAILGLGVAAMLVRRIQGGPRRDLVGAAALLALMALFRPTEALVEAGALGVFVLLLRRDSWRVLIGLGAGLGAGWLPWVIENSVRFGGPIQAYRVGSESAPLAINSVPQTIAQNIGFTNGTKVISDIQHLPPAGVIWWASLVALAVYAMARGSTDADRTIARLGFIGAVALAAEYIVFVSPQSPRYLLPAYGFVSLPAAIALVSLFRRSHISRALASSVLVLAVPWAVWQGSVAQRVERQEASSSAGFRAAGLVIRRLAAGQACIFLTAHGQPEIQFASGCKGARFVGSTPSESQMIQAGGGASQVFVVLARPASPDSPLGSLSPAQSAVPGGSAWFIYRVPRPSAS